MNKDFTANIKSNIKKEDEVSILDTNTNIDIKEKDIEQASSIKFKIAKKKEDKEGKVNFPFYTDKSKQKELDKIAKKTGYSRNELINIMIDFCIKNIEFEE
jgi:hypothetical protein